MSAVSRPRLTCGSRVTADVVPQLRPHHLAQQLVPAQRVDLVTQHRALARPAHPVHQHDLREALVDFRVLDEAHEGRRAGAGGDEVQPPPGAQVGQQQGAGRLGAHQYLVAGVHVLQARGEGPVRDLDAEELEVLLVVGAGDAVGAQQRSAAQRQAEHHELAVLEAQAGRARGAEGELRVRPVPDREHALAEQCRHG